MTENLSNRNKDISQRMKDVKLSKNKRFSDLINISRLNPKTDLRFNDWSFSDFTGSDLRGYDFTGARLWGCNFLDTLIEGAKFDQAEIGYAPPLPQDFFNINNDIPWSFWQDRGKLLRSYDCNLTEASDYISYVRTWRRPPALYTVNHLPTGTIIQDAPFSPKMTIILPETYVMGSSEIEINHKDDENLHKVTLEQRYAMACYPVTFSQWDFSQNDREWKNITNLNPRKPNDQGWGRANRPVIDVDYDDALAYAKWLSVKTNSHYRLPTEIEWEHSTRARSTTSFWWGDFLTAGQANYNGNFPYNNGKKEIYRKKTVPIRRFEPNPFGLYQVHGNVWEWCLNCYEDHPDKDNNPILEIAQRGGSWFHNGEYLRSAYRGHHASNRKNNSFGFRLMKEY